MLNMNTFPKFTYNPVSVFTKMLFDKSRYVWSFLQVFINVFVDFIWTHPEEIFVTFFALIFLVMVNRFEKMYRSYKITNATVSEYRSRLSMYHRAYDKLLSNKLSLERCYQDAKIQNKKLKSKMHSLEDELDLYWEDFSKLLEVIQTCDFSGLDEDTSKSIDNLMQKYIVSDKSETTLVKIPDTVSSPTENTIGKYKNSKFIEPTKEIPAKRPRREVAPVKFTFSDDEMDEEYMYDPDYVDGDA